MWFIRFIFVEVKCEFGDFDDVIDLYKQVLEDRLEEDGVVILLM